MSGETFFEKHGLIVESVTKIIDSKNARIGVLEELHDYVTEVNRTLQHQLVTTQQQLASTEADNLLLRNQLDEIRLLSSFDMVYMKRKLNKSKKLDQERREQVNDLVAQLQKTQKELAELVKINEMRLQTNIELNRRVNSTETLAKQLPAKEARISTLTREIIIARLTAEKSVKQMETERTKHQIYIEELERQYKLFMNQIENESCSDKRIEALEHTIVELNEQHEEEKKLMYANLQIATRINVDKLNEKEAQIVKLTETVTKYHTLFKNAVHKQELSQSSTS